MNNFTLSETLTLLAATVCFLSQAIGFPFTV